MSWDSDSVTISRSPVHATPKCHRLASSLRCRHTDVSHSWSRVAVRKFPRGAPVS